MTKEDFYERCAQLLGTTHEYREPPAIPKTARYDGSVRNTYKTRYIGRDPGNGRFPDRGIVRHYGTTIHVALTNPPLFAAYPSVDAALTAIELAVYMNWRCSPDPAVIKAHAAAHEVVRRAGVTVDPRIAAQKERRKANA